MSKKTVALLILDGFGYSEESTSNAIKEANTPTWDHLWQNYPHSLVATSGMAVGLPEGQMGNSEVGHMNIGAGRIVYQNFTRVNKDIEDGEFFNNSVLCKAVDAAMSNEGAVHIMGLLSPGGVHSHEDQILAMCELAAKRGCKHVYVHAFLDGRDTPPRSAKESLAKIETKLHQLGAGRIVSMIGRYYAMDRDNRWERVQQAFDLLTLGKADIIADSPLDALAAAYSQDKDDEFCPAASIRPNGEAPVVIDNGDAVIFMNFRPDRAREISNAFVDPNFSGFNKEKAPKLADFVMLTEYASGMNASCAYPPSDLVETLGEVVSKAGKTQLRIAETEKYAHVTFFFSGGQETEFAGEDRILVPSPNVATYDLQPEMSAPEVTEKLCAAIESGKYDLVVCNYANGDMVGHTGNMPAAIKAVEALDEALKQVTDSILKVDGACLITADHGNAEQMVDPATGGAQTSHTTYPVPLVYIANDAKDVQLADGRLCDLAPSLLKLLGLEQPQAMTGKTLL